MCCLVSAVSMRWFADSALWLWAVVVGISLATAVIDYRTRRIPNALTGPLLLGGLLWGIACSTGVINFSSAAVSRGIGDSLLGALVAALPFFILWMAMGAGAGDAKLMMAIGAWVGMKAALLVLVCTALAGGVVVIVWALTEGRLLATLANLPRAAVDLAFLVRGPGKLATRRQVVLATAAAHAPPTTPELSGSSQPRQKLPYGPAIFAGTCLAALRVFLS